MRCGRKNKYNISANLGRLERGSHNPSVGRSWPGTVAANIVLSLLGNHPLTTHKLTEPRFARARACGAEEWPRIIRGFIGNRVKNRRVAVEGWPGSHFCGSRRVV